MDRSVTANRPVTLRLQGGFAQTSYGKDMQDDPPVVYKVRVCQRIRVVDIARTDLYLDTACGMGVASAANRVEILA